MSNEIVKFSNQFNNVALKKFDAVHLDVLMAIASRVIENGVVTAETATTPFSITLRYRSSRAMATSPDSNSHSNGSSSLGTESVSSLHRGGAPFYRIFCTLLDSPQALRQ